jgi:glucose dehydrogenase
MVVRLLLLAAIPAFAQVQNFRPVTTEMLVNPSPNDWLMYSRTYDAQRYSPLNQINKRNVNQLRLAWLPRATDQTPDPEALGFTDATSNGARRKIVRMPRSRPMPTAPLTAQKPSLDP